MTDEEFVARRDAIGARYLGAASNQTTEDFFRSEITALVAQFYAEGGVLLDLGNRPLWTFDEVNIVVGRTPHKISAQAVRRTA